MLRNKKFDIDRIATDPNFKVKDSDIMFESDDEDLDEINQEIDQLNSSISSEDKIPDVNNDINDDDVTDEEIADAEKVDDSLPVDPDDVDVDLELNDGLTGDDLKDPETADTLLNPDSSNLNGDNPIPSSSTVDAIKKDLIPSQNETDEKILGSVNPVGTPVTKDALADKDVDSLTPDDIDIDNLNVMGNNNVSDMAPKDDQSLEVPSDAMDDEEIAPASTPSSDDVIDDTEVDSDELADAVGTAPDNDEDKDSDPSKSVPNDAVENEIKCLKTKVSSNEADGEDIAISADALRKLLKLQ